LPWLELIFVVSANEDASIFETGMATVADCTSAIGGFVGCLVWPLVEVDVCTVFVFARILVSAQFL
jgi:hypothetical protein